MFGEVPVLPVVVPLAAVVLLVLLWVLQRRDRLTAPRAAVALALCAYAGGVVANTVFPIYLDMPGSDRPWHASLSTVPLVDYEVADAVMNIVVFVPVGVLVPLLVAGASWRRVLAVGTAFSLAIEVSQYIAAHLFHGGHVADVNDLLFNVVGALLGFGLLTALTRVPRADVLVRRFSWH